MKAARRAARDELSILAGKVERHANRGRTVTTLDDVVANPVNDPWGNAYVLDKVGDEFGVRSYGPDGKANTDDDLVQPVPVEDANE